MRPQPRPPVNPANPAEDEGPKRVVLEWEEIQLEYIQEETDDESDENLDPIIKQFETAEKERKPIIIFIYTDDMTRKAKAKREASENYMNDVLSDPDVAEQLQLGEFKRLKCNVDKIEDDNELRRKYRLTKTTPTIVLYYFDGRRDTSTTSTNPQTIVSRLKSLIKKNEKQVERLERRLERED